MSDFAQLLQGLAVLLIVSGAFALLLQRIFLFFKGSSSSTGCGSGCSSCPSRCSQPRDTTDEDSIKVIPISNLRKM